MTTRTLDLAFDADPVYLRVVRLAASSMAADAELGVRATEDLVLAVDELTTWLMMGGAGDIRVRIATDDDGVTIRASGPTAAGPLDDIATAIVTRASDRFRIGADLDGYVVVKLRDDVE